MPRGMIEIRCTGSAPGSDSAMRACPLSWWAMPRLLDGRHDALLLLEPGDRALDRLVQLGHADCVEPLAAGEERAPR